MGFSCDQQLRLCGLLTQAAVDMLSWLTVVQTAAAQSASQHDNTTDGGAKFLVLSASLIHPNKEKQPTSFVSRHTGTDQRAQVPQQLLLL
eukprot:m.489389 g.489389  ORF g.489389 m.489389 type:complete len:90 (-) comp26699_c0_seq1:16-285(-)